MVSYSSLCIYWRWPKALRKAQLISVLCAGFLIQLSLGSLYTYGNLAPYIVSYVRERSHPASLRYTDATFVFAAQIAGQGLSMAFGGLLEKRFGPRLVSLFGGWFMSLGVLLTYFAIQESFWLLLFTYGFMFGLGIGIAYIGPISCAMRWLPKWKGIATGIVVSGFGLSALFFDTIESEYINPHNKNPDLAPFEDYPKEKYFSQPDVIDRVPSVFLVLGSLFAFIQILGAIFLVNPAPSDEVVVEYHPPANGDDKSALVKNNSKEEEESKEILVSPVQDSNPKIADKDANILTKADDVCDKNDEKGADSSSDSFKVNVISLFKRPEFYILWIMFFCIGIICTFTASLYKSFGFEIVTSDDTLLSLMGAVAAIFNCLGRIIWGLTADLTDYNFAFVLQGSLMIFLISNLFSAGFAGKGMFFVWVCAIFFCIGGYFSLFPSISTSLFGSKYSSMNYGFLFTANAVGSLTGAFISQWLVRLLEWYGVFFLLSGIHGIQLALSFFLCYIMQQGKKK